MTRAELEAALAKQVLRVIDVSPEPLAENDKKLAKKIQPYQAQVLALEGADAARVHTCTFYVVDEGEETESAYWIKRPPRPADQYADAINYMRNLEGAVRFAAEEEKSKHGYAIMRAWMDDGQGNVEEKRLLLYYDADGQVTHKPIAG